MHFKTGKLVDDIRKRCDYLLEIRDSVTFEEFSAQLTPHTLAERHFEIVGEAAGRLRRVDSTTAARITDLDRVIGLRNLIAHGYEDLVILEQLWDFMTDDVPVLRDETAAPLVEFFARYGPNPDIGSDEP